MSFFWAQNRSARTRELSRDRASRKAVRSKKNLRAIDFAAKLRAKRVISSSAPFTARAIVRWVSFFWRKTEPLGFVNYHEGRSIFSLFRRKLLTCERCPQRVTFERAKARRRHEALPQSGNLSSSAFFGVSFFWAQNRVARFRELSRGTLDFLAIPSQAPYVRALSAKSDL